MSSHYHPPPPPRPPRPPHPHHSSSSNGSSGYNGYNGYDGYNGNSGGWNYNGGGESTNFPYKNPFRNMTAYSGLMFLVMGAFIVRMFSFFKQHCTKLDGGKRQGYLNVGGTHGRFAPFRDNPLRNRKRHPSSPKHPAIATIPPKSINSETMNRLQNTGIRMVAHGVHCDPRKVWLSMDDHSINWQSEFQKEVPDIHGNLSAVAVRGSLHRINWSLIEYIDVGKRTDALKQATHVADHLCFSLLTPEGSLDLQTNSQLERDTLVSCIGMKLDELLGGDWRQLYTSNARTSSSAGVSSASETFSSSSFSTINQPFPEFSVNV